MSGCAQGRERRLYESEADWFAGQVRRVRDLESDEQYREAYLRGLAIVRDEQTAEAVRRAAQSSDR